MASSKCQSNAKSKTARFTPSEVYKLLEEVEEHKFIILRLGSDKSSCESKKKAWAIIAKAVSSVDPLTPQRSPEQCLVKFRDLKRECRYVRKTQMANGDGLREPKPIYYDTVMEILGEDTEYWKSINVTLTADKSLPEVQCETEETGEKSMPEIQCETEGDTDGVQDVPEQEVESIILDLELDGLPIQRRAEKRTHDSGEGEPDLWATYMKEQIELIRIQKEYYTLAIKKLKKS